MLKFLISGFEPFGGDTVNPTAALMQALEHEAVERTVIKTLLLPVHFDECADLLIAEMKAFQPDVVIACGLAKGRTAITPERIAINVKDIPSGSYADNQGQRPVDEPITAGSPDGLFSTLPIRAMVNDMVAAGIPAAVSNTAGTYICNNTMYRVLDYIRIEQLHVQAGFVHFPASTEMAAMAPSVPSLPLSMMLDALHSMIRSVISESKKIEG
ncbi:pyroglutamyl-peptidase I [Paenibacillus silvae]|uniref:pyroglutamyl-peptidase I n=1 Tax=Paenibacillus silvae TaxID=1325358 RepID=UPI002002C03C|nr:pyroglutamyl-peptidase I [Paenibacillus silvae]MCK6078540.1 pyroglutamyl-peptidase I [Paenibacillus silvae]MCK6152860.1 pyroglutamyl-peptidase I [Paenibacillus silvae]MCK6271312.1 pyroglutamyl-peptidase I [Paenibacillus silvae]